MKKNLEPVPISPADGGLVTTWPWFSLCYGTIWKLHPEDGSVLSEQDAPCRDSLYFPGQSLQQTRMKAQEDSATDSWIQRIEDSQDITPTRPKPLSMSFLPDPTVGPFTSHQWLSQRPAETCVSTPICMEKSKKLIKETQR